MIWWMFMVVTMESVVFMGKNYQNNCHSFAKTTDLTLKQMFDIAAKIGVWTRWDLRIGNNRIRIIVSTNQLSLYGAVAEMCEEYESRHERTGATCCGGAINRAQCDQDWSFFGEWWPSISEFSISTIWRTNWEPLRKEKLSKICMDAGFLTVVENGQYFMTKDTGYLTQFNTVACREYTLPKEESTSQSKGLIQRHQKLDPCWKLQPVICTVNMELRSESCLWAETIFTPGSEFLMDQISLWWMWTTMTQKFRKISSKNMRYNWMRKILHADQRVKQKPQRRGLAGSSPRIVPLQEGIGSILNQGNILSEYEVSNKVIHLLRHSQKVHREEDGVFHFWRIKQQSSESSPTIYYSLVWLTSMESMFGCKRKSKKEIPVLYWWFRNNCLFPSSSRTLRTQSCRSFSLQDNVVIPIKFSLYICHVGCAFNLHSTTSSGLIRSEFEQETDSIILPVDFMGKGHKDP